MSILIESSVRNFGFVRVTLKTETVSCKFTKQWFPMHWDYELQVSDDHVMCWIKNVSIKIKVIK